MGQFIDRTGQRFGRLTIITRAENEVAKDGHKYARWVCACDCGNEITLRAKDLVSGNTKSCGCYRRDLTVKMNKKSKVTHGGWGSRLYKIWQGMRDRCYNKNLPYYKRYGGRGIIICPEWKEDFKLFHKWAMDNGYADDLTIDRIDVNGNYEPSNCRWITMKEQHRNTRQNHVLVFGGQAKTMVEWSEITGIPACTISSRIRRGWSAEKTISTPVDKSKWSNSKKKVI